MCYVWCVMYGYMCVCVLCVYGVHGVRVYVCVYVCIRVHVYVCVYICTRVYVFMCVCVRVGAVYALRGVCTDVVVCRVYVCRCV